MFQNVSTKCEIVGCSKPRRSSASVFHSFQFPVLAVTSHRYPAKASLLPMIELLSLYATPLAKALGVVALRNMIRLGFSIGPGNQIVST